MLRTLLTEVEEAPAYKVVLSIPLSDTQRGDPGAASVPGDAERPHAFTSSGSVRGATPGWSDTRLTCRKPDAWWWACPWCASAAAAPAPTHAVAAVSATTATMGSDGARFAREPHTVCRCAVYFPGGTCRVMVYLHPACG